METAWNRPSIHGAWPKHSSGSADGDQRLAHVERLARLLDSEYALPGTNFRFGLDPLIGLIPGFGNVATSLVSVLLIWTMMRHGASGGVVARMAVNTAIDSLVGAIPIVGNLFDFAFRANQRNVELLRRHYAEGRYQGSGRGVLVAAAAVIFTVLGLAAWAVVALLIKLIDALV